MLFISYTKIIGYAQITARIHSLNISGVWGLCILCTCQLVYKNKSNAQDWVCRTSLWEGSCCSFMKSGVPPWAGKMGVPPWAGKMGGAIASGVHFCVLTTNQLSCTISLT